MSPFRKDYLSVENEIAVHPELPHESAAAEPEPGAGPEAAAGGAGYCDSVAFEPGSPTARQKFREMMAAENAKYSCGSILLLTLLSGVVGGVFAVPGVFLSGGGSAWQIVALTVFGPFTEETLKQSGMFFQLEKLPGSVRHEWQFFVAGALGGLVFAALENLIYQFVYLRNLPPDKLAAVMAFRWSVCVAVHVGCTMISALGLRRVWRDGMEAGEPCQIAKAFPWFMAAMAVHGGYNLFVWLFNDRIFG